jgi:hypothetical protein
MSENSLNGGVLRACTVGQSDCVVPQIGVSRYISASDIFASRVHD